MVDKEGELELFEFLRYCLTISPSKWNKKECRRLDNILNGQPRTKDNITRYIQKHEYPIVRNRVGSGLYTNDYGEKDYGD